MVSVEISELSTRAAEIVETVQLTGEPIDIAKDGVVIARVVPVTKQSPDEQGASAQRREAMKRWLEETERLAQEIGRKWPASVSAQEALDDVRGPW